MEVKGKAAIVTGGGSGLGAATARALAKAGAKVSLLDVNLAQAEKWRRKSGARRSPATSPTRQLRKRHLAAAEAFGEARILINCAGIAPAVTGRRTRRPA
jgi:NAD(P)-dependent dehydrogenase (short-subunit alcohol dehydrogenase family)